METGYNINFHRSKYCFVPPGYLFAPGSPRARNALRVPWLFVSVRIDVYV